MLFLGAVWNVGPVHGVWCGLSDRGTQMMASFYAEMGSPATASILTKGRGSSIYHPSGASSLALRIATSLGEP